MDAWVVDAFRRRRILFEVHIPHWLVLAGSRLVRVAIVQVVTGAALSIRLAQFANCDSITRRQGKDGLTSFRRVHWALRLMYRT